MAPNPVDRTADFLTLAKEVYGYVSSPTPKSKGFLSSDGQFALLTKETFRNIEEIRKDIAAKGRKYLMFTSGNLVMSEKERNNFDTACSERLEKCLSCISKLKSLAETASQEPTTSSSSLRAHRFGAISSLIERLQSVQQEFSSMRIKRFALSGPTNSKTMKRLERESRSSVNTRIESKRPSATDVSRAGSNFDGLGRTQRKQLLLEGENHFMLTELMNTLEQVKSAEKTALEIAALNQFLSMKLSEQAEEIETLYNDTVDSLENVQRGNRELRKLSNKGSSWNFYFILGLLVASFSLIFLHIMS
eukprot:jgi/Galph1/2814/GphlegSOOS_G1465.1